MNPVPTRLASEIRQVTLYHHTNHTLTKLKHNIINVMNKYSITFFIVYYI